jgi:hypothetical protein
MAAGMDETAASVAAGSATGAFYDVDFSKSLKGQGKTALKGAVKGGVKAGISANKSGSSDAASKGGALRDNKGIASHAMDSTKEPVTKGGAILGKKVAKVVTNTGKKVSKIAKAQSESRFDPNIEFAPSKGGSMRPISGGSMRPIEGKGVSGNSGAKRPTKGSDAAKEWGAKMRAAREAKKK